MKINYFLLELKQYYQRHSDIVIQKGLIVKFGLLS